ncbi:MAG: glycosyl hydrolase family 32 [Cyanobacteria bacterium]|nr:glycosyl hydrolase family 32 [Cyanobacteriota bacterium]
MRLTRRTFVRATAAATLSLPFARWRGIDAAERLYNGITLGTPWPPRLQVPDEHPITPPYLVSPPATIPIDVGRQLFVDDFLIESTNMVRTWHAAVYHPVNPVLKPEQPWELRDEAAERTKTAPNPAAMVFSDGVFYDPKDRLFKMWYMSGYGGVTSLATSEDGIAWKRPNLDVVPGTNVVSQASRDSSTVWLDLQERDPKRRYKMSLFNDLGLELYTSPDGVHWTGIGRTGFTDDRSTFFFNPFRNVWCFSLRANQYLGSISGRFRKYWESPDFAAAPKWNGRAPVAWVKSDSRDFARPEMAARSELYNLDCVAYESVMLGLFSVWRGESGLREKINEVTLGFSRDGFHWHRPERKAFLPVSDVVGSWNWANVQSAGGGCLIVGDQLYFYVSGRQGRPGSNAPGVCSTGLATLRRDGFASMDFDPDGARVIRQPSGSGTLTTRPITFAGEHLFVNADVSKGQLRAEVLDDSGNAIAPFTIDACAPYGGDSTKQRITWSSAPSLAAIRHRRVRLRFAMTRGQLFSFWVSADTAGHSGGYPAAGGPEFSGPVDRG